ncbi:SDR family oxidoreductase [Mucilaginibacter pallidiroseus]|uniref:SDR family oxidoreductase n=1 Tax=Mucilaginibacter pallidiroseus TaxID=2599295 RepID=A0A563U0J3_9SPHI|nr:SDR family oxidoreductase [Mucilaginibacter pallidiroseus]TWR25155.1 SDR family oxidoreductase [Mucilaginibacter pallidiroseus]
MRVFVTGASGFVGSAVVNELLSAGHTVLGLVRSDSAVQKLQQAGAEAYQGDVNDIEVITKCAAECDAVIHTDFNHDFSKYKQNCEDDRRVITAFAEALKGTDKPLVITSGVGLLQLGRVVNENDALPANSEEIPRAASEEAAIAAAANGVNAYIVRLPSSVHDAGDHGFVPMVIGISKEKGKSGYINDGLNKWPAVHRSDAAKVYRLVIEQQPAQRVFHAVGEEGIAFREIAQAISKHLHLPLVSLNPDKAKEHFTWFAHFASFNSPSSNQITCDTLGWKPTGIGLIQDMEQSYF